MTALSIRQPWAWLICNASKGLENRSWYSNFRGHLFIHASSGMTRAEYFDASVFASKADRAVRLPRFEDLKRGGIVGEAKMHGCLKKTNGDPWFVGPFAFELHERKPLPFMPVKGALGFFFVDIDDLRASAPKHIETQATLL